MSGTDDKLGKQGLDVASVPNSAPAPRTISGFPGATTETEAQALAYIYNSPLFVSFKQIRDLNLQAGPLATETIVSAGQLIQKLRQGELAYLGQFIDLIEDPSRYVAFKKQLFDSLRTGKNTGMAGFDQLSLLQAETGAIATYIRNILASSDTKNNGTIAQDLKKLFEHGHKLGFSFDRFKEGLRQSDPELSKLLDDLLHIDDVTVAGTPISSLTPSKSGPSSKPPASLESLSIMTVRMTRFAKFANYFTDELLGIEPKPEFKNLESAPLITAFQSGPHHIQAIKILLSRRSSTDKDPSEFLKTVSQETIDSLVATIIYQAFVTKKVSADKLKTKIAEHISNEHFDFGRIIANPIFASSQEALHFINEVLSERPTTSPPPPAAPVAMPVIPHHPPSRPTLRGIPVAQPHGQTPAPPSTRRAPPPPRSTQVPPPHPRSTRVSPPPLPAAPALDEVTLEDLGGTVLADDAQIPAKPLGVVVRTHPPAPSIATPAISSPSSPKLATTGTPAVPSALHLSAGKVGVTTYPPSDSFAVDLSNPKALEPVSGMPTMRVNFVDLLNEDGSVSQRFPVPSNIGDITVGGSDADTIKIPDLPPHQFVLSFQQGAQPSVQANKGSVTVSTDHRAPETIHESAGKNFGTSAIINAPLQTDQHLFHTFRISAGNAVSVPAVAPNLIRLLLETIETQKQLLQDEDQAGSVAHTILRNRYTSLLHVFKEQNIGIDDSVAQAQNRLNKRADEIISKRKDKTSSLLNEESAVRDERTEAVRRERQLEALRRVKEAELAGVPKVPEMMHQLVVDKLTTEFPKGYFCYPGEKFDGSTQREKLVDYTGPVLVVNSGAPISGGFNIPGTNLYVVPLIIPEEFIGSNKKVCTIDVLAQGGGQGVYAKVIYDAATGGYYIYNINGKLNHEGSRVHHSKVIMEESQQYNVGATTLRLFKSGAALSQKATTDCYDLRAQQVFDRVFDMAGTDAVQDRQGFAWIMDMIKNGRLDGAKWFQKINDALTMALDQIETASEHHEDAHLFETISAIIDDPVMQANLHPSLKLNPANPNQLDVRQRLRQAAAKDIGFYNDYHKKIQDAKAAEGPKPVTWIDRLNPLPDKWVNFLKERFKQTEKRAEPEDPKKLQQELEEAKRLVRQGTVQIARFIEMELLASDDFSGKNSIEIDPKYLEAIYKIARIRILLEKLGTGNFGHTEDDKVENVLGPAVKHTKGMQVRDILSPEEIEVLKQDEYFMGLRSSQLTALEVANMDAVYLVSRLCNKAAKNAFDDAIAGKNTSNEQAIDIATVHHIIENFPVGSQAGYNRFDFTRLISGDDPTKAENEVKMTLLQLRLDNESRQERERHERQQRLEAELMAKNLPKSAEQIREEADRGTLILITGDIARIQNSAALQAYAAIPELLSLRTSFIDNPFREETATRKMEPGAWDAIKGSYVAMLKMRYAEAAKLVYAADTKSEVLNRLVEEGLAKGYVAEQEIGVTAEDRNRGVVKSRFISFKEKALAQAQTADQEFTFLDEASVTYKSLSTDTEKQAFAETAYEVLQSRFSAIVADFDNAGKLPGVRNQIAAYTTVDKKAHALMGQGYLMKKTTQSESEFGYELINQNGFTQKLSN